jgi:hypothetical protein
LEMNKNRTIFELSLILSGTFLTFIFLYVSKPSYWISGPEWFILEWFIKFALSFFTASFIFGALGMILEARSRVGGLLLLAVSMQFAYSFYESGLLSSYGIVLGMAESGYLTYYSVVNNRFDRLALYMRRIIKIFFGFFLLYLLIKILSNNIVMGSFQEASQFNLSGSNEILKVIILLGTFCAVYYLLMKTIYGIRAFDVFVYGPSRSGKTLLLLALYSHFISFLNGRRREFIVSDTNEERLKIENMLTDIESGKLPKSNLRTDLAIYVLSGKKNLKPVGMTFVDYGGEHTKDFKPLHFKEIIAELDARFNIKEPHKLEKNIENLDFIKNLRDAHKDDFAASVDKVTFAHIYKKFESAGKIVFLVDGDHIVSYHNGGKNELTKLFGHYSDIINLFGSEKSYAIVMTKTDQFKDISTIMEDSEDAQKIEREIYDIFCEIPTFKEIVNMASQMPIYMYAISVDATMKPLKMEEEETEMQRKHLKINPWRVGEIEKFSL